MSSKLAITTAAFKIGSSMMWERISGMRPKSVPSIPPSFDRITREWLTSALCQKCPGAEVVEFNLKGG
ncbi:MAG: aminoglycoside phosphotransferase family protein, partial [Vicinamibacterales bacterium]